MIVYKFIKIIWTKIDTNYSNPDKWADPDGYASIENSKGTTVLDRNFIQLYPGVTPAANTDKLVLYLTLIEYNLGLRKLNT